MPWHASHLPIVVIITNSFFKIEKGREGGEMKVERREKSFY